MALTCNQWRLRLQQLPLRPLLAHRRRHRLRLCWRCGHARSKYVLFTSFIVFLLSSSIPPVADILAFPQIPTLTNWHPVLCQQRLWPRLRHFYDPHMLNQAQTTPTASTSISSSINTKWYQVTADSMSKVATVMDWSEDKRTPENETQNTRDMDYGQWDTIGATEGNVFAKDVFKDRSLWTDFHGHDGQELERTMKERKEQDRILAHISTGYCKWSGIANS